jgi:alpha/beta superfamily hydrolase
MMLNPQKNINYEVYGKGQEILLLHGFSNDLQIWKKTGWIQCLKENYKIIALDLRGSGKSTKFHQPEDYSIGNHLSDIRFVLDNEKVKSPIIWGWSFGGTIAMHYAKDNHVKHLIIGGTYFGKIFTKEYINQRINQATNPIDICRWQALEAWPIIFPKDLRVPMIVYTGTNDGTVFKKIEEQKHEIQDASGKVIILEGINHYGLISETEIIKNEILSLILDCNA